LVWAVDLDSPQAAPESLISSTLSAEERDRAARFVSAELARRWSRSRYALRRVLGDATGVAPGAVRFRVANGGKPSLEGPGPPFSLAHSAGRALIAVGARGDVGVDVERVRAGLREVEILGRVVGAAAVEEWRAREPARRTDAFFRLWVRREAALKCRGLGIAESVGRDVAAGLELRDLVVDPGYVAAWASDDPASGHVEVTGFAWEP
jgi:4'-phosphopantetheinyl transferase